jgi:penicillin-binding protein 2
MGAPRIRRPARTPSLVSIIESYKPQRPRLLVLQGLIALGVVALTSGLAYRQLFRSGAYGERERLQNQRRVLVPGPRGNIYDRNGRLLVGNRSRFGVTLYLGELRDEFRTEYIEVVRHYRASVEAGDITRGERPTAGQLEQIARAQVVQRYLDKVNRILGRDDKVDVRELDRHFRQQLLLPYLLVDDLKPDEYARLLEQLPVNSPLQVYTSSTRYYPYGSAAAQTLGYVSSTDEVDPENLPGQDLKTYTTKGTVGRNGIELEYDSQLQGRTGGTIYRVDPSGFRVNPPIRHQVPVQGHDIRLSLDINLQVAAENAMGDYKGAVVALDAQTGEVLVLASKPDYDLNDFSPRISRQTWDQVMTNGALLNRAVNGLYPPGSTFKLVTSVAGLLHHVIIPGSSTADCEGAMRIGGRVFRCDNGYGHHGVIGFSEAIAKSCDIYFYTYGLKIGPDLIAETARMFHLNRPTGIDLPFETTHMLIPDPAWKKKQIGEAWFAGDTANMSIGQGFVRVTPLQMACLVASIARDQTTTVPTLLHEADRPPQHSDPIGLTPAQYAALIKGMEGATTYGTASLLTTVAALQIPGLDIAGKTGTAQVQTKNGTVDVAWFVCFAPIAHPRIAVAVTVEGDKPGDFYGSREAAPVADAVLKAWMAEHQVGDLAGGGT